MSPRHWISLGAFSAALGVALGALGAHALEERLEAAGQLASWHTAVAYQMWHALALILFGLLAERRPQRAFPGWAFLVGSLFFSGSLYLLALEVGSSFVWPFTPLGGVLLIAGWLVLAIGTWRARQSLSSRA